MPRPFAYRDRDRATLCRRDSARHGEGGPGFRHRSFGQIDDQAADLPQEVLARLGGGPHPLRRRNIAPGETPTRTLVHAIGGGALDGTLTSKEIAHAVTSLPEERASAADLAKIARPAGHRIRALAATPPEPKTREPATPKTARRSWPRYLAISLLYIAISPR
jgi:hypothetical protein